MGKWKTILRRRAGHLMVALISIAFTRPICEAFQTRNPTCIRYGEGVASKAKFELSASSEDDFMVRKLLAQERTRNDDNVDRRSTCSATTARREILIYMAAAVSFAPLVASAQSTNAPSPPTLEDLQIGQGRWTSPVDANGRLSSSSVTLPASFCTYLTRFLINYDAGVASWWQNKQQSVSLLSDNKRQRQLGQAFGKFAASLKSALESFLEQEPQSMTYSKLFQRLRETYRDESALRHIGILCAILPKENQPKDLIRQVLASSSSLKSNTSFDGDSAAVDFSLLNDDFSLLLPDPYHIELLQPGDVMTITPPIGIYEVGLDEEFGQSATATTFGPLSSEVLTRDLPLYSPHVYALFGISGATGCALSHSVVIPLDVVKTKAQTDPVDYSNVWQGATKIVRDEGWSGLVTGAQATLAGYFWYGLSVYPSYTFFKRYLSHSLFAVDWSVAHANNIALLAGALAAVVASLGLTPLEAARIRVVADPNTYKPLGLTGTLQIIASEDAVAGWKRVYAGLPSLLTRQVMFGSVKFLAFERACDAIYTVAPSLRDATWTALSVSLIAGGFSGALSSVVSQPADAVLTYVARSSETEGESMGILEASQVMVQEGGVGALFRGLGSRCVWAGSIIAGQFLLYDVFRNLFGVAPNDLSQVFQVNM